MKELYFKEQRFFLTRSGELFARIFSRFFYLVLFVVAVVGFFAEATALKGLAFLLTFFLIDRFFHRREGEYAITEIMKGNGNVALALTPAAYRAINMAFRKSLSLGKPFSLALFESLLKEKDVKESLRRLDYELKDVIEKITARMVETGTQKKTKQELIEKIEDVVKQAFQNAYAIDELFIDSRNLFSALFSIEDKDLLKTFQQLSISLSDVKSAIIFGKIKKTFSFTRNIPAVLGGFAHQSVFVRHRIVNRSWTSRPTPLLDKFSVDLTDLARAEKAGFLIGHKKEFDEFLQIISRPGKPNALLVGEPGSGKSTMIAHLAYRIIKDQVPSVLFDKRLVSLNVPALIANANAEELAGRLQKIIQEILFAQNIVLFIPNTHDLFRTGSAESINAIDILLPIITSEVIPVIGETYPREFKQFIAPRSDFLNQFDVIRVQEISVDEAVQFLIYMDILLERQFRIFASFRAVRRAVDLAHRYFSSKPLPGSAVDLLKQAFTKAAQNGVKYIDEAFVESVAETQTNIPIQSAGIIESEKLLNLEERVHKKFINQDEAVSAVSRALREYRSGISRKGGPIATFLFVGPTGVGKTELAKILALIQFGSKDLMSRFDMSEYQDKQSIFRFIGTPDGQKTGFLTDSILANPYCLVLLDEFEKAHPDILNLFLQVFDDGRLTDGLGRIVNFENTIIIATSNAHSEFIKESVDQGKTISDISETLKKKLTDYFKPELINRFSDVIVFRNLNQKEIISIARLLLGDVTDTVYESNGIILTFTDVAVEKISELGYDPTFGARPLRKVISDKVRGILAEKILKKEIQKGDEVRFDFDGNEFRVKLLS